MISRTLSRSGFVVALGLVVAFKLWLIRGEEIVGSSTQYDALWYVRSASHWYWGTPYDWIAFIRPCAYPLWLATVHWLHLPLRLAIELLQLGGSLALVAALRRLGLARGMCVAGFVLLSLHPIGFQQNDYTMSDTFYSALLWYSLAGLLLTLSTRRHSLAIASGFALAILWHTREEGILLLLLVGLWAVLVRNARLIATTVGTAALVSLTVYAVNDRVFFSFARSEMTAPVFQSLYHSLLRIEPAESKPYAPITMDTLERAFAASPTLRKLRAPLEGPLGEAWRVETMRRTGTPNEIGVGWIVWATRQAASVTGVFASPKIARRFFAKASQEIEAACDGGRLRTRFVLDGFLDPFVQSGGLRRFPVSAGKVAARTFARWTIQPLADDPDLTTAEASLYDRMTLRGSPGVPPRTGPGAWLEKRIGRSHYLVMIMLHLFAATALIALWRARRRLCWKSGPLCAVLLLLVAVLSRAGLLAWLDATAFDATQDRFLLPILPLWSALLVVVIAAGLRATRRPNEIRT